jgi:hypothetical protein
MCYSCCSGWDGICCCWRGCCLSCKFVTARGEQKEGEPRDKNPTLLDQQARRLIKNREAAARSKLRKHKIPEQIGDTVKFCVIMLCYICYSHCSGWDGIKNREAAARSKLRKHKIPEQVGDTVTLCVITCFNIMRYIYMLQQTSRLIVCAGATCLCRFGICCGALVWVLRARAVLRVQYRMPLQFNS